MNGVDWEEGKGKRIDASFGDHWVGGKSGAGLWNWNWGEVEGVEMMNVRVWDVDLGSFGKDRE